MKLLFFMFFCGSLTAQGASDFHTYTSDKCSFCISDTNSKNKDTQDNIIWPDDVKSSSPFVECTGQPNLINVPPCALVGVSYTDTEVYKKKYWYIYRRWLVVEWNTLATDSGGIWIYTQKIKLKI